MISIVPKFKESFKKYLCCVDERKHYQKRDKFCISTFESTKTECDNNSCNKESKETSIKTSKNITIVIEYFNEERTSKYEYYTMNKKY